MVAQQVQERAQDSLPGAESEPQLELPADLKEKRPVPVQEVSEQQIGDRVLEYRSCGDIDQRDIAWL